MTTENSTTILFDTLFNNQEDMDFFLTLYYGFPDFYRKICMAYYGEIFLPALEAEIDKRNEGRPEKERLKLNATREDILKRGRGSHISSEYWLGIKTFLMSTQPDAKGIYSTIHCEDKGGFPEKIAGVLNDAIQKRFPLFSRNQNHFWLSYDEPYWNWENREAFSQLISALRDLQNHPQNPDPFAKKYIDDLMSMVDALDEIMRGTER